jgi:glycosyltransferase involved in cell wall biosynthesis
MYCRKFIVTIHDLTLLHFPTVRSSTLHPMLYRIKFLAYRIAIKLAIMRARSIVTISQFTKKDIIENYGEAVEKKIFVTYESADDYCMFSVNNAQEVLQKYGIIKPYLIYVGNAYPHKNLERLVLAFAQVWKQQPELQLVLVGKRDYFYDRLHKLILDNQIGNIILLSDISDYTLDILFHHSIANIFPSLYEGFGLPPLEAMSKGVPVISSDHPCMREILGESAYFFDGKNTDSIAQAIEKIISDESLRQDLIARGYAQAKKYSWKRMARETQAIYIGTLKADDK